MSNLIRHIAFPRLSRIGTVVAGLGLFTLLAGCATDKPAPARPATGVAPVARPVTTAEAMMCRRELAEQGADFRPLNDLLTGGGCSSTNAVALYHLVGDDGRFAVTNVDRIGCTLSQTVASWARYGVDRAARQMLGSGLAKIETFGSYSCRNVAGSSRRSAHSNANALDVAAFVLVDGRRISVKDGWDGGTESERRFLRVVQGSACKRFGTVLGPDYNAAHNDHFHVEMGDGSFCR